MAPLSLTLPHIPPGKRTTLQKEERQEKLLKLRQDLAAAQLAHVDRAKDISKTHGRSLEWSRRQLNMGSRKLIKTRKPSAWNGFVGEKCRTANEDLDVGSKWKLPNYTAAHAMEIGEEYKKLNEAERDGLRKDVGSAREAKLTQARLNSKAVRKDIDATFETFEQEFQAVEQHTGCRAFFIAVRGDVEHHNNPKVYMGPDTVKFITEVFNMNPKKLALQYEAYIVGGTSGLMKSSKVSIQQEISDCRMRITDSLYTILKEHRIPTNCNTASKLMNYMNYEKKIVETYGVELKGWPCARFVNPGQLRRGEVQQVLAELTSGGCRWVKLSEEELHDRIVTNNARHDAGEDIYRARKPAKGKEKAAEILGESDTDNLTMTSEQLYQFSAFDMAL